MVENQQDTVNNDLHNPLLLIGTLRRELAGLMRLEDHEILQRPDRVIAFRGEIYGDTEEAYDLVAKRFATHGYSAWLRDRRGGEGGHEVLATRGLFERHVPSMTPNILLLIATIVVVLFVGASYAVQDAGLITDPSSPDILRILISHLYLGIPFAATLIGILLTHELSHYFVAQRYGAPVSLPYFIPMPNILGTMGAVIVQRAPMRSRKALFDIGAAGPIGGLIVAIPLLILGLSLSEVGAIPPGTDVVLQEGNSLLYIALKLLVFGQILPSGGLDVWLHPVAFAAWAGILVTMLNLLPVGQLDGGHIAYALLGDRAETLGKIVIAMMVVWGVWLTLNGNNAGGMWVTWGFANLLLNRRHPAPQNDATKLGTRRIAMALLVLGIFIITFMPSPLQEVRVSDLPGEQAQGIDIAREL
ncbi:MAG: site-2 protease family protein [Anaerolineae bacterium]|nr:site-2 protease family protein [Anaerolineae bacterium]